MAPVRRVPRRPPEGQERSRAEELRIAAEIHELCAAHGSGPELADALVDDDDHARRRRYTREATGAVY